MGQLEFSQSISVSQGYLGSDVVGLPTADSDPIITSQGSFVILDGGEIRYAISGTYPVTVELTATMTGLTSGGPVTALATGAGPSMGITFTPASGAELTLVDSSAFPGPPGAVWVWDDSELAGTTLADVTRSGSIVVPSPITYASSIFNVNVGPFKNADGTTMTSIENEGTVPTAIHLLFNVTITDTTPNNVAGPYSPYRNMQSRQKTQGFHHR